MVDKEINDKEFLLANIGDNNSEFLKKYRQLDWYEIGAPALQCEILQAFFDSQNLTQYWREGYKEKSLPKVDVIYINSSFNGTNSKVSLNLVAG